jgi:hypothetical protein
MEKTQYIVALEIGSSKIVGAIAEKTPTGHVNVSHLEEEPLSNCVRYGCVQNVENTKNVINRILKKLGNSVDGIIKEVYVGVSGHSVHSEPGNVSRNLDSAQQITNAMIDKIIKSAVHEPMKNYEVIDIVPRTFFVDNDETANPSGRFGSNIEIQLNKIVAKTNIKLNLERVMNSTVKVKQYLVTPLVVAEQLLTNEELSLGCMLVDIGAETTTVAIYKNHALVYLMTLPMGGRNITRDLVNGLQVVEEQAELVKKNIDNPLDTEAKPFNIDGINAKNASNYILARTGEIIANINKQISYADLNSDSIKSIVLIGGGARLKGLQEKLEQDSKIKVRIGSYPTTLNILDHAINKLEYIEIFALLAKGAEVIPAGFSCLERRIYGDGPTFNNNTPAEPEPTPEPKTEEKPQKKKKGFLKNLTNKMKGLLDENDADDDR